MTLHRDDEASKMGMWIFLFTELLLFGGLFLVYSIYRHKNPDPFAHAGSELDVFIGTINTIALITSSLTVALSITAIQKNKPKLAIGFLWLTIVFALVFMVNKYFEWGAKFEHGLFPGQEHFMSIDKGEQLFFFLYFFMTGLHGLHVVVGSILLGFVIMRIRQKRVTHDNFVFHENGGLYWHLVDLIWIYLFPLFYLIK
ncbi:MAG: cytochrome c oxidase subunit 3 family protein [Bacteroidetes bacterium]|jgi:cytochrome c oxidase subunit 3|nr:cytochrome c oxidase subunit 3 family protein [Bacteroidota bacterium]MBT5531148.1 cytochrome c oxidase subunit 3 family protein [Cytophagia bacterium]MBT3422337.1 cytochrome c oxidase subunit 3 family protein [Bacteroidota bacterium]MBT3801315.1 cytochrome c oxidase subunit 3 family protein [Bacteroidota bacterium]MBT3934410.1 cytochrome c oxidase subunit 3 family protein [Bacteroidota bacterium]